MHVHACTQKASIVLAGFRWVLCGIGFCAITAALLESGRSDSKAIIVNDATQAAAAARSSSSSLSTPVINLLPAVTSSIDASAAASRESYHHRLQGNNSYLSEAAQKLTVSVLSFSNGQIHCDRNSILNVCYQDFPRAKIELLVAETSTEPSKVYSEAMKNPPCGDLRFRYQWFNASAKGKDNPALGALRNLLSAEATGDVLINMDNDDFYHPLYVQTVVDAMVSYQKPVNAVFVHPHVQNKINPDGTIEYSGMSNPGLGAHFTSIRKSSVMRCPYGAVPFTEEKRLFKCLSQLNATIRHIDMTHNYGNSMLLIKFKSGMSITNQRFFRDREEYARTSRFEWASQFAWQSWRYEELHEVTRPRNIKSWWGNASSFEELFNRQMAMDWKTFHLRRHKEGFFNAKSLERVSQCEGFASMPGQFFQDRKTRTTGPKAQNDRECCAHCKAIVAASSSSNNSSSISNKTCTAFEFRESTKTCYLFVVEGKVRLPEQLQYAPSTLMEIHTYGLVKAYSKLGGQV